MSNIVNNITISGFKVYGESCDSAPTINTLIGGSSPVKIYSWQNSAAISAATGNYTVLLQNGTGYAGVANVDTFSVMINTTTADDQVFINGYQATIGVGSGGSTAGSYQLNWHVWNSQCVNSSNVPTDTPSNDVNTTHMAYTVAATGGSSLAGSQSVSQIKLSGSFSSNQGLPARLGSNNINIVVKNSAGTTVKGQYNFNVVVTQSDTHITSMVATPSPAGSAVYSPAFDSDYCAFDNQAYSLIVAPGTTSVSLLPVLAAPGANPSASITVSCPAVGSGTAYYQVIQSGVSTGAIPVADDSIITLVVTAADGVTQQTYTVSVQANTGNNYLGSVAFKYNNVSSLVDFQSDDSHWSNSHSPSSSNATGNLQTYMDYQYLNCLPNVNYGITASIFASDQNSTISFNGGVPVVYGRTNFFIPYSSLVQGGITTIPVVCTSPVGISRTYTFQIWVASNAALNKAAFTNIAFSSAAGLATPFVPSNFKTYASLADIVTNADGLLPTYTVYVSSSIITATIPKVNIIMTYNDNGCRYSVNNYVAGSAAGWVPADINTASGDVTGDNWTLNSQRTVASGNLAQNLTASTQYQTLIASHLPNGQYYGYRLQYIVPGATLANLSLFNSSNDLPIALSPAFNSTILSYGAFIGTSTSLANTVKLNVVFTTTSCKYTVTPLGGNATSEVALTNNTTTLISLGAPVQSYVLTINLYDNTPTLVGSYTVNLMNIDSSLLLSNLEVFNATYTPASGSTPASYSVSGSAVAPTAPNAFSNTDMVYQYGSGLNLLYYAIKPTVSYPSSQNISISINGGASVPVVSGANFYMPSSAVDTVVITISDNLIPQNSNQYTLIIFNQSTDTRLKLANFMNIPNSDWSTVLPDGTASTPATFPVSNLTFGIAPDSVNSSASVTAFTATPNQTGTLMYIVQPSGFVPLLPGVPSANIPLNGTQNKINAWSYANDHDSYCNFVFTINKIISINSLLSSFVMTNANPFVFNSLQYVYNGITLQSGQTSFSFTATAQDNTISNTSGVGSIVCTMNGINVTGSVSNGVFTPTAAVAVLANVNNVLLVTVTALAGTPYVTTYTFNITRPSTSLLSNIRVFNSLTNAQNALASQTTLINGEAAVNPTPFVPTFFTYSSEVTSDVTTAYVVLAKSTEASISMVNGTYQGNTSGSYGTGLVGQIWAVPVQLGSTPNSLVFQLNPATITVTDLVSTNVYNLSIVRSVITTVAASISLVDFVSGLPIQLNNMSGAPVAFDPQVFTYTIPASMYAGHQITTSIIGANGVSNTYYLNGAVYYIPQTYVIDASHPITINVVSNSNLSVPSVYQISLL